MSTKLGCDDYKEEGTFPAYTSGWSTKNAAATFSISSKVVDMHIKDYPNLVSESGKSREIFLPEDTNSGKRGTECDKINPVDESNPIIPLLWA